MGVFIVDVEVDVVLDISVGENHFIKHQKLSRCLTEYC